MNCHEKPKLLLNVHKCIVEADLTKDLQKYVPQSNTYDVHSKKNCHDLYGLRKVFHSSKMPGLVVDDCAVVKALY